MAHKLPVGNVAAMRVLVVEDEVDLADAIVRALRQDAYAVDAAYRRSEAEEKLMVNAYDLVCLDWNLPDGSGRELAEALVEEELVSIDGTVPKILMLTARDDIEDRVWGLDSGADDYLVKPFSLRELRARVRAVLRRDLRSTPGLSVGDIELSAARHLATRNGLELDLTPKEFGLLAFFMSRPDEVLSQETLLEHVWDEMADPFTNTVRMTISNLRKKLGEPQPIKTVPGVGYRLVES